MKKIQPALEVSVEFRPLWMWMKRKQETKPNKR